MSPVAKRFLVRFLPVLFMVVGAALYAASVERADAYIVRNLIPMVAVVVFSAVTLLLG